MEGTVSIQEEAVHTLESLAEGEPDQAMKAAIDQAKEKLASLRQGVDAKALELAAAESELSRAVGVHAGLQAELNRQLAAAKQAAEQAATAAELWKEKARALEKEVPPSQP
jgi:hypothetical protein